MYATRKPKLECSRCQSTSDLIRPFNSSLSVFCRICREKIEKELNDSLENENISKLSDILINLIEETPSIEVKEYIIYKLINALRSRLEIWDERIRKNHNV